MKRQHHTHRNWFCRWLQVTTAASAIAALPHPAEALTLTRLTSDISKPIGIGYHDHATDPAQRFLVVSVNRDDTSGGNKFAKVDRDGIVTPFATYSGTQNFVTQLPVGFEVKLATIRSPSGGGAIAGGFALGDTYCGTGLNGQIMRINANGTVQGNAGNTQPLPFATLPGATSPVLGITHDRDNVIGGCLVVLTADGKVWKVNSAGATLGAAALTTVANGQQLEACLVVPNDVARYGSLLAGKILVGRDDNTLGLKGLWTVDPAIGTVAQLFVNAAGTITTTAAGNSTIGAEDLDLIAQSEYLFASDFDLNGLLTVSPGSGQFTSGMAGDLLITQEGGPGVAPTMLRLQATSGVPLTLTDLGVTSPDGGVGILEHVTFAPIAAVPAVSITAVPGFTTTMEAGGTPAKFNVHRSNAEKQLIVTLQFTGSAGYAVDYQVTGLNDPSATPRKVTFSGGVTDVELQVLAFDDSRHESVESVLVTVQAGADYNAAASPNHQATVSILSDDFMAMPSGWKLYDLGTLGTGSQSWASGIGPVNTAAQPPTAKVVGSSYYLAGNINPRAYTYTAAPTTTGPGGTMTALPIALSGGGANVTWSAAYAVSPGGRIVGQYCQVAGAVPQNCLRGFYWDGVGSTLIQLPSLASDAIALGVTPGGSMVGYCAGVYATGGNPTGVTRACLWDAATGNATDLGTLAGTDLTKQSYAYAINPAGRIVGKSQNSTGAYRAYRTQPNAAFIDSSFDDLGVPLGAGSSEAGGINDFDEVAGQSGTYSVLWLGHGAVNTAYNRLWVPTSNAVDYGGGQAINNKGMVVGWRQSGVLGRRVPVLWWNDGSYCYDFQSVESGPSVLPSVTVVGGGTWVLQGASAINDSNWIVGYGTKNGQVRGYLLKPN